MPFAFNRKEAKDHGEGGTVIGGPLSRRVLIVDDVISAGTSVRESVELMRKPVRIRAVWQLPWIVWNEEVRRFPQSRKYANSIMCPLSA